MVHAKSLQSCPTLFDPMDCSPPGSSVHGILHEEYWSGLPGPPPSDLPHPGSNLCPLWLLHWQTGSLPLAPPGKPFIPSTQVQFLGRELRSCFKPPLTAVSLRSDGGPQSLLVCLGSWGRQGASSTIFVLFLTSGS